MSGLVIFYCVTLQVHFARRDREIMHSKNLDRKGISEETIQ